MPELALKAAIFAAAVAAAAFDVRRRRVPNWISLPALAASLILIPLSGRWEGLLAWPVLYAAWSAGWIGGGDAKLLMAVAAAFGVEAAAASLAAAGLAAWAARRPVPGAAFAPAAILILEAAGWLGWR
jgi:Flp pilus assembly protein protease CpaA